MELNPIQFKGYQSSTNPKVKQLNRYTKRMYPQLAEQLNLLIKQAKWEKLKKEIGGYP